MNKNNLRFKVGGWQPLADALGLKVDSLVKVGIDDLLARWGALIAAHVPALWETPSDFEDEETVVEDRLREAVLKLVK